MNPITSLAVIPLNGRHGSGLNGLMFREDLSGVDLFVGANNAGKTTRLLATTAAIVGFAGVPTDPKRPFIGVLPTDTGVELTVQTEGGPVTFTRDLSLTSRNPGFKAADATAAKLLGAPEVSFNLSDFSSATDGERAKVLDAVARTGGKIEAWDVKRAQEEVRVILEAPDDEGVATGSVGAEYLSCVRNISTAADGASWLSAALVWADARQTETNAGQKADTAAAATLAKNPVAVPFGEKEDNEQEEELRQTLARLDDAKRNRAGLVAARDRHVAEGARLAAAMEARKAEGLRLKEPAAKPPDVADASYTERLTAAKAALDLPIPAPGVDLEALTKAVADAETASKAADKDRETKRAAYGRASQALTVATNAMETADDDARKAQEARWGVGQKPATCDATCRHCGQADPLGASVALEEWTAKVAALEEALAMANAARTTAMEAQKKAQDTESTARRSLDQAIVAASSASDRLTAARSALARGQKAVADNEPSVRRSREAAVTQAQADVTREEKRISASIASWERAEKQRLEDIATKRAEYKAAKAAHDAWAALPIPEVPAEEDDAPARQAITEELQAISTRRNARAVARSRQKDIEKAATKAAASVATWGEAKALVSAIKRARDVMASAAYAPINDAAQALLAGTSLPVPYFAGPDDYGATVNGARVPFHALGQSARLLTGAALVYALAVAANNPCRLVLLDGIEVLKRSDRIPLLAALARSKKAGLVDNVLLTMSTDDGEEVPVVDGVTVHRVVRVPRVVAVEEEPAPVVVVPKPAPKPAPAAVVEDDEDCPF